MTDKNDVFSIKASLLDPAGQIYKRGTFDWTAPADFYLFSGWSYRFDLKYNGGVWDGFTGHPHFQRNLGVERYTFIKAGTRLYGTNQWSFIYGCLPSQTIAVQPSRYADAESLYYERINRVKTLPDFQIGNLRPAGSLADCRAYFPAAPHGVLITAITSHGGSWTTFQSDAAVPDTDPPVPYIIATQDEINDGHEVRFTNGWETLQPIRTDWFPYMFLGVGTRSDAYGVPNPDASWCGAQGVILPSDW